MNAAGNLLAGLTDRVARLHPGPDQHHTVAIFTALNVEEPEMGQEQFNDLRGGTVIIMAGPAKGPGPKHQKITQLATEPRSAMVRSPTGPSTLLWP